MSDSIKELVEIPQAFIKEGTHVSIAVCLRRRKAAARMRLWIGSRDFR